MGATSRKKCRLVNPRTRRQDFHSMIDFSIAQEVPIRAGRHELVTIACLPYLVTADGRKLFLTSFAATK